MDAALVHTRSISPLAKILITDLHSLYILHPRGDQTHPSPVAPQYTYESTNLPHGNLSALRIAIAAFLHNALPEELNIYIPESGGALLQERRFGPSIAPDSPLRPDEEVHETCKKHSDFDALTLMRSTPHALQFFRWKKRVMEMDTEDRKLASTGDTVRVETNGFTKRFSVEKPYYPLEPLPEGTLAHMNKIRRRSALHDRLLKGLRRSDTFSLELLEELTAVDSSETSGLCQAFKCRIKVIHEKEDISFSADYHTEADGLVDVYPPLFVKFFYDRFIPMDDPTADSFVIPTTGYHVSQSPKNMSGGRILFIGCLKLRRARSYLSTTVPIG